MSDCNEFGHLDAYTNFIKKNQDGILLIWSKDLYVEGATLFIPPDDLPKDFDVKYDK